MNIPGHDILSTTVTREYQPYDRLVVRGRGKRSLWTVLDCERAAGGWRVIAIRYREDCRIDRKKRGEPARLRGVILHPPGH